VGSVTVVIVVRVQLIGLVALAACSFEHAVPMAGGGNGSDDPIALDAPVVMIDAAVDAAPTVCTDDDADGVCNAVDDWPCGAKPPAPPTMLMWSRNSGATTIKISNTNLDATGAFAVATAQEMLSLKLDYAITDTACSKNCIDQIEIGWVPGRKISCPFDGQVSKQNGATGSITTSVAAPMAKAVYDLRVELGQNFSCWANGATGWWDGQAPSTTRTIAKLCVH
jgi:hypothetical protein